MDTYRYKMIHIILMMCKILSDSCIITMKVYKKRSDRHHIRTFIYIHYIVKYTSGINFSEAGYYVNGAFHYLSASFNEISKLINVFRFSPNW